MFEPGVVTRGPRWRRTLSHATFACLLALGCSTRVHAYCRESLDSSSTGPCMDTPGVPDLYWARTCLTQTFNNQVFARIPALSEAEVRGAFSAAFQTWAAVDCNGRKPFLVQQASGVTATSKSEFLYDAENESIIVVRTANEWLSMQDHDANALALTLIWHDKTTGEILDVDMELNAGAGAFSDCVKYICTFRNIDLQNTITHEGGHLLGLGHSTVPGSTMEASTGTNNETSKRVLKQDDKDGYCALDLPQFICSGSNCTCSPPPIYPSHRTVKTCGCRTIGAGGSGGAGAVSLLGLCALAGWRARQRLLTRRSRT